jgi:Flp pilus assembly protein TadD
MKPNSGTLTTVNCVVPRISRTRRFALLVLAFLVPYRGHIYAQAIDTRAIYAKDSDAVVLVLADQIAGEPNEAHEGTGIIVTEDGSILSVLHVIKGAGRVTVKLKDGDVYDDVRVTAFDARRDLVVLKVPGFGMHKVTLGNSDDVKIGESVALISNPEGLEQSISQGIISGARTFEDRGYKVLQTSAAASHGSSGGAILNAKGELIAIASSKLEVGENLNFGIPIDYARGMLPGSESLTLAQLGAQLGTNAKQHVGDSISSAPLRIAEDRWWRIHFVPAAPIQNDHVDAVIASSRERIRLNPNDDREHVILGMVLRAQRDLDGASAEFREAIRLNPNNSHAHSNLGSVLYQKGDLDAAIAELREAIRLHPEGGASHLTLGEALEDKGDIEGAIAEYRQALRISPASDDARVTVQLHMYLGYALRRNGDLDGAIEQLGDAVRLDSDDYSLHSLLGASLDEKGDRQGALGEYRAAYTLNPDDSDNKKAYLRLLQKVGTP